VAEVSVSWKFAVALDWRGAGFSLDEKRHAIIGTIVEKKTLLVVETPSEMILSLENAISFVDGYATPHPTHEYKLQNSKWEVTFDQESFKLFIRLQKQAVITISLNRGELRKMDWYTALAMNWLNAEMTIISTDRGGRISVGQISELTTFRAQTFIVRRNVTYPYDGGARLPREDGDILGRGQEAWWCEATRTFYVTGNNITRIIKLA